MRREHDMVHRPVSSVCRDGATVMATPTMTEDFYDVMSNASQHDDPLEIPVALVHTPSMSGRGIFLVTMAFVTFEAFALFIALEMARVMAMDGTLPHAWTTQLRQVCAWILVAAIPFTTLVEYSGILPASVLTSSSSSVPVKHQHGSHVHQAVAWVLYTMVVSAWCYCGPSPSSFLSWSCLFDMDTSMVAIAFLAEILMSSSILAKDRCRSHSKGTNATTRVVQSTARKERLVVMLNNFNNMLLVVGACLLAIDAELSSNSNRSNTRNSDMDREMDTHSITAGLCSLALFITALFNTYGLGGLLESKEGWQFYQPFKGGFRFMLFQAISWTCFAAGLFIEGLYLLSMVIVELELFMGAMAVAGSLFLISEVVMMMSLLVFRSKLDESNQSSSRFSSGTSTSLTRFLDRLRVFTDDCLGSILLGILTNLQWVPSALFFVLYAVTTSLSPLQVVVYSLSTTLVEFIIVISRSIATHLHNIDSKNGALTHISPYRPKYIVPQLITFSLPGLMTYYHIYYDLEGTLPLVLLSVYFYIYVFSYRGKPQLTGSRMKPSWMKTSSRLIEACAQYFHCTILREVPLDPNQHYIMSFHPHGIMSTSVMWMTFTNQWRTLFPNSKSLHILTASVLHQIPWTRDVLQYYGGREVTREAFTYTLQEKESVLVVPGGQAEMIEQQSGQKEIRIITHHKGFIRIAMEQGVPLVPILSFQEGEILDNINAPLVQRWFIKKLAFPFPYFPYGRLYLPIPRRKQICIAVGAPLHIERNAAPTNEDVDVVHAQYFARLQGLFDKYKEEAQCNDYKLVFIGK